MMNYCVTIVVEFVLFVIYGTALDKLAGINIANDFWMWLGTYLIGCVAIVLAVQQIKQLFKS